MYCFDFTCCSKLSAVIFGLFWEAKTGSKLSAVQWEDNSPGDGEQNDQWNILILVCDSWDVGIEALPLTTMCC